MKSIVNKPRSLLTSALICARQRRADHKDSGIKRRSRVSSDIPFKALFILRHIFTCFSSWCLKKTIGINPVKQPFREHLEKHSLIRKSDVMRVHRWNTDLSSHQLIPQTSVGSPGNCSANLFKVAECVFTHTRTESLAGVLQFNLSSWLTLAGVINRNEWGQIWEKPKFHISCSYQPSLSFSSEHIVAFSPLSWRFSLV